MPKSMAIIATGSHWQFCFSRCIRTVASLVIQYPGLLVIQALVHVWIAERPQGVVQQDEASRKTGRSLYHIAT